MKRKKSAGLLATEFDTDIQRRQPSSRIKIEWILIEAVRAAARNARTHSKKQIRQIARSIKTFGFVVPIVVDNHSRIIAGHGRLEAAKLLGLTEVPVIRLCHLTEPAIRALALADNRVAEKAGWNRELLAIELEELSVLLAEVDLDLGITGFEPAEIDGILLDLGTERPDPADEIPATADLPPLARLGDLFLCGKHCLLVGDARNRQAVAELMQGETAAMAFLDPPYNVRIDRNVSGHGRIKHREFVCASGEMTPEQYTDFLEQCLTLCAQYSVDGAIHYVCIDWHHAQHLLAAGEIAYTELKNVCVWVKSNVGQGTFYRSQHEFIFVFKNGTSPHLNNFELGQHGRTRSNVWQYAGGNAFRAGRMDELKMHPTVKPTAMVVDAMRDCSRRGDIVLDVFCGSGTTIMAAEQIGRRAYCMELDPIYADVSIRRWQAYTGRDAILKSTGQTFDELEATRGTAQSPPPARRRPTGTRKSASPANGGGRGKRLIRGSSSAASGSPMGRRSVTKVSQNRRTSK